MTKLLHGKVHGRTIKIDEELGLSEGQPVLLAVQVVTAESTANPTEAGLEEQADDLAWVRIMKEIYEERHKDRAEVRFE